MATPDRDAATLRVIEELKRLYKAKIFPLEKEVCISLSFSHYCALKLFFLYPPSPRCTVPI